MDYLVDANFNVSFGSVPRGVSANENFTVTLDGDRQSLSVESGQELLIFKQVNDVRQRDGDTMRIDCDYHLNFMNLARVVSPVSRGIQDLKIEGDNLTFNIGQIQDMGIHLGLYVERRKIGRNPILINRNLKKYEYQTASEGDRTKVTVNLKELLSDMNFEKKHDVKVSVALNLDVDALVNKQDLPANLRIDREYEYRP